VTDEFADEERRARLHGERRVPMQPVPDDPSTHLTGRNAADFVRGSRDDDSFIAPPGEMPRPQRQAHPMPQPFGDGQG
jgi:hypothetical protein